MNYFKKYILTGTIAFTILFGNVSSAYAEVNPEVVASFQELKELSKTEAGLTYQDIDGHTYIVDKNGSIKYGWQYDSKGNLYYISSDGMIRSASNTDGIYFSQDGCFINPSMINPEKNLELSKRFENGETLKFSSKDEILDFLEYYSVQYRYQNDAYDFEIMNHGDGSKSITIPESRKYDREALINDILTKFGPLEGNSPYEKILDGCQKITNTINYDLDYINADLQTSLTTEKGVCRHYAKCLKVLLDDAGIQNEIMVGYYNGSGHMWLRCLIGDEWVYVDPTAAKQIWWNYSNIPYQTVVEHYIPARSITIQ